jgi:phosphoglycolate phosphatase-like HAD superfamily hydrolase
MPKPFPFTAVLFDLDGVLIDATDLHYRVWGDFARARGFVPSREQILATNGRRAMSPRSCRVTIRDPEGIKHTAEVTAESLYEAIAPGLKAIRESSWVEGIAQNFAIRVLVRDTPVEHTVEFRAFNKWLEQRGRTPKEIIIKSRIREILGLSNLR